MNRVKITVIAELDKDLLEVKREDGMTDKNIIKYIKRQAKYSPLTEIPLILDFHVEDVEPA